MGAGIAQLAIEAGYVTVGREVTAELGEAAAGRIGHFLTRKVEKGQLEQGQRDAGLARFTITADLEDVTGCDFVIEAIVEELEPKLALFAQLDRLCRPEAILATNTSALSVTEIAAATSRPERVVGMHFFNPVAVLPLVELARTAETDDVSLATVWAVTKKLRKTGVLVRDAPAFVVNRLLGRQGSVVMQALDHGNTVEETDEAVLRMGLPMAPSVLLQLVGPKVANHVRHTLHEAWPDRYPLSKTLESLADGGEPVVVEHAPRSIDELHTAVLEALADESRHILEEGVVAEAADIDTCLLLGAGFPFWLGGITKHLDQTGVSERIVGRPLAELSNTTT
jgi:3-hydroxyacyl-CoA dehydrogenase